MRYLKYFLLTINFLLLTQAIAEDEEWIDQVSQYETPSEECAICKGKFDTGPAYINIDVLQRGKTFRSLNLFAWKADAYYEIYNGFTVKASGMIGGGEAHFYTLAGGVGFCIPFKCFSFFPNAGYCGGNFKSTFDLQHRIEVSGLTKPIKIEFDNVEEDIDSHGPYIGIDITYKISKSWRAVFVFQYAWSHVDTEYKWESDNSLFPDIDEHFRTKTSGPNYALLIEHDFSDNFSVNLGLGYNMSLSKDKEGLRAKGAKIGAVYWF